VADAKAGRMGKPIHRLTDKNSGGGAIDEILQKTVFANNLLVSVDGSKGTGHGLPPHSYHDWQTEQGSKTVFAENIPVNFQGNQDTCGDVRVEGSPDVFVGDMITAPPSGALGADRPARNYKEPAKSGNASPSNIACRQKELDDASKNADPNDPNKDQAQKQADIDDPNKPVNDSNGVPDGTIPPDGSDPRSRLLSQLDSDYANRSQWQGGASSPAGQAAFQNVGYGNAAAGTPWCAAYLNSNLKDAGAGYAASASSQSPKCFPQVDPANAQAGDAVVWSGHTAFIQSVNPDGTWTIQGGNQGGGAGAVTRFKVQPGAGISGQSFQGVYNPYGTSGQTGNCVPAGGPSNPHNPNQGPNKSIGADCPAQSPQEQAASQGTGAKTNTDGITPSGTLDTLGRTPDAIFSNPSSILAGGGGGLTGLLGGGGPISGLFGGGGGSIIPPQAGPYNTPPATDPVITAKQIFDAVMLANPGPAFSDTNTYQRAVQLAISATGNSNPSGADVQRFMPDAQKAWWNETMAANQYRYDITVSAYQQAGITTYHPPLAETITRMMAYHSGWGNSRGLTNAAYEVNNPLGVGWDGTSWYKYTSKAAGITGMWDFIAYGADGSRGRYMIPNSIPSTVTDDVNYIYSAGFTDGTTPKAVLLIKDPNNV
jgi:hypothetical protein